MYLYTSLVILIDGITFYHKNSNSYLLVCVNASLCATCIVLILLLLLLSASIVASVILTLLRFPDLIDKIESLNKKLISSQNCDILQSIHDMLRNSISASYKACQIDCKWHLKRHIVSESVINWESGRERIDKLKHKENCHTRSVVSTPRPYHLIFEIVGLDVDKDVWVVELLSFCSLPSEMFVWI